ncbi:uncharacterized protein JCM10292_002305 [Rhodotorula paludigena]|uniref:uncharacterized protein n=1 Tax=Rhodotorula paludigena TaxID=86838 RepID=UPI00316B10D1
MCFAEAILFYGITVPVFQLVVAARSWPQRFLVERTINVLLERRKRDKLTVEGDPAQSSWDSVLCRVPVEIWAVVKVHVAEGLRDDEADSLVHGLHSAGERDCTCPTCLRTSDRDRAPRTTRYTLEHLAECDDCDQGLRELGGTAESLEDNEQLIKRMLYDFNLDLPAPIPISGDSVPPRFDVRALCAVAVPNAPDAMSEPVHGEYDYENDIVELRPRYFVLPKGIDGRFEAFLRACPMSVESVADRKAKAGHSLPGKGRRVVKRKKAAGLAKWHLWSSCLDCE